jgi:intracellular multiplication protein IcmP
MAAQQQQQQGDNSLAPLWITAGLFIFGWIIWIYARGYIVAAVLKLKLLEASFIGLFAGSASTVADSISAISPANYDKIPFEQLVNISNLVGSYYQYPVAIALGILAVVIYFSQPTVRFRRTHSMQTLAAQESQNWPQITPVVGLNLIKEDVRKGPWAMALTPIEFAKKHNLIIQERIIPSDAMLSNRAQIVLSLKRGEAERIFSIQLGRPWINPDQLNIQTQAIFAILAARINGDRESSEAMLKQISYSSGSGKLDFSGVKELLRKNKDNKKVLKIRQTHAYVLSVMASLLKLARQDGVLASADFLWLKPADRSLWYMLNSVGRQTAVVEAAGPFAHWLAETEIGHKIYVPMVKSAVNALEIALKEMLYREEDEE